MREYPWSSRIIPTCYILQAQWPHPHSDHLLLSILESDFEDTLNEIRNANSNIIVLGKTTVENDKEEYDNGADDDEVDHAEESEGDEYEQETG